MPWLPCIDPLILWKKRTLRFVHAGQEHIITETDTQQKRMCHVISAVQFVRQIKKKNPAWICVIKPSDVDKNTKKTKVEVDCSELLKEFANVEADPTFPEPRNVDLAIDLEIGSAPAMGPIFRLAPHELVELRKQLDDLLEKG